MLASLRFLKCTVVMGVCVASLVTTRAQALEASPTSLVFSHRDQAQTITLTHNGQPLRAEDIKNWEVYVDKNTYRQFFTYKKGPGTLTLTPSALIETGSWDFVITTTHGAVKVRLETPLNEDLDSLETRAKELGITVDELRIQMGFGIELPRNQIQFNLAPQYVVGQSIRLKVTPVAGRTYRWSVNGQTLQEGPEAHDVTLGFDKPGAQEIKLEEHENGTVTASSVFNTMVVMDAAPAGTPTSGSTVNTSVGINTNVTLQGPAGYSQYRWTLDTRDAGAGPKLTHRFRTPGTYTVTCTATGGPAGAESTVVTYQVIVTPPVKR